MRYGSHSIDRFLGAVASERVTPAGGTVAAFAGAAAASLCEMVCVHTIESGGDAAVVSELADLRDDLRRYRGQLLSLADADADAVDELVSTRSGGNGQSEAKRATAVPLAIAEVCLSVLEHAPFVTEHGNSNAVPDAVTGAFLAHAAVGASAFIVRSNVERLDAPSFGDEMDRRATAVERSADDAFERALARGENDAAAGGS